MHILWLDKIMANFEAKIGDTILFGEHVAEVTRTFTDSASLRILPQDTASSGRAPESEPSNSCAVLINTEKSAPFLYKYRQETRDM